MSKENREAMRIPVHSRVLVRAGDIVIDGEADNISTSGMLVRARGAIPRGQKVDISLNFYGTTSHLSLSLKGEVVRNDEHCLALTFDDVEPDSFIHLRNMVASRKFDENRIVESFDNAPIDLSVHD